MFLCATGDTAPVSIHWQVGKAFGLCPVETEAEAETPSQSTGKWARPLDSEPDGSQQHHRVSIHWQVGKAFGLDRATANAVLNVSIHWQVGKAFGLDLRPIPVFHRPGSQSTGKWARPLDDEFEQVEGNLSLNPLASGQGLWTGSLLVLDLE